VAAFGGLAALPQIDAARGLAVLAQNVVLAAQAGRLALVRGAAGEPLGCLIARQRALQPDRYVGGDHRPFSGCFPSGRRGGQSCSRRSRFNSYNRSSAPRGVKSSGLLPSSAASTADGRGAAGAPRVAAAANSGRSSARRASALPCSPA